MSGYDSNRAPNPGWRRLRISSSKISRWMGRWDSVLSVGQLESELQLLYTAPGKEYLRDDPIPLAGLTPGEGSSLPSRGIPTIRDVHISRARCHLCLKSDLGRRHRRFHREGLSPQRCHDPGGHRRTDHVLKRAGVSTTSRSRPRRNASLTSRAAPSWGVSNP